MRRLKRVAAAFLLTFWSAGPLVADAQSDVKWIIQAQIDALQRGDFDTAFVYASPELRSLFYSSRTFAETIEKLYPMIWEQSEIRFLTQRSSPTGLSQMVMVVDRRGERHLVDYAMVNLGGYWRVQRIEVLFVEGGLF